MARCSCDACTAAALSDGYCAFCDQNCYPRMSVDDVDIGRAHASRPDRLRMHGAQPARPVAPPLVMHPVAPEAYLPRQMVDLFLESLPNPRVRAGAKAALATMDFLVPVLAPDAKRIVEQAKRAINKRRKPKRAT